SATAGAESPGTDRRTCCKRLGTAPDGKSGNRQKLPRSSGAGERERYETRKICIRCSPEKGNSGGTGPLVRKTAKSCRSKTGCKSFSLRFQKWRSQAAQRKNRRRVGNGRQTFDRTGPHSGAERNESCNAFLQRDDGCNSVLRLAQISRRGGLIKCRRSFNSGWTILIFWLLYLYVKLSQKTKN